MQISKCCNAAPVVLGYTTQYYVCTKCGNPCDVEICPKCWHKNGILKQGCPQHHQEYEPEIAAWETECRDRLKEIEKARNEENRADEQRETREYLKHIR